FLGRKDDQVKIRGYRVEPGEVESVLTESSMIKQGVVVASKAADNNSRLLAYVVPAEGYEREALLTYLKKRLPDYMVPSAVVTLDQLPLTPNGKIDRKALPQVDVALVAAQDYAPPVGRTETCMAQIWEQLLQVSRAGR
ncbi:amino acid adenylation domain-containing protein, partial [Niastella populi]|uniref:amino acid adenylation domain-containing protein n=1 Tax=Niastella populi TaxID=550983 RepID=UPI0013FD1ED1